MIILFFILAVLLQGFVMGCFAYCGVKVYGLPHLPRRWRIYMSAPFFAVAVYLLVILVTAPFNPRPAYVVLWAAIVRLIALIVLAGAIGALTLFLFGWINGIGAKTEARHDSE